MRPEYQIVLAHSCSDAPGRFVAESKFGRSLDMRVVCEKVRAIAGAKCSESMGVARFDYKDWTLILYSSGRIDFRKIANEEEARVLMGEIESMIADAFI